MPKAFSNKEATVLKMSLGSIIKLYFLKKCQVRHLEIFENRTGLKISK